MTPLAQRVVARFKARSAARYKTRKKLPSGNTVYLYSDRQIAFRTRKKAERLAKLKRSLGKLRSRVKRDLQADDPDKRLTALAVALIDHTYERVGNEDSADEGHVGVTGWQRGHVSFSSGKATIKYVGKAGVHQKKVVSDSTILNALKDAYEAVEGDDASLFSYEDGKVTAEKVNAYLEPFGVTAKDIRGFHANEEMKTNLKAVREKGGSLPEDRKERKAQLRAEFLKALDMTAKAVGHEASTLRSQYLLPEVEEEYFKS